MNYLGRVIIKMDVISQIDRVRTLSEMVNEKLVNYELDIEHEKNWEMENPNKETWRYYRFDRTTPTEVGRIMLVLRQEMIKLEKML